MQLQCGDFSVDLTHPVVMGVVNVTPDSFSDGGRYLDPGAAVDAAHAMVEQGAALVDIGGESTRPGAAAVPLEEERRRVIPVLQRLAADLAVPVSIDTSKPELMVEAASEGAGMINDVYALRLPGALGAAAQTGLPICLMHMQGEPRTMQTGPSYADVVKEVIGFLKQRVAECLSAGIPRRGLVVDPGFGFGKALDHNLQLLARLGELRSLGLPVLAGLSRKSMIGAITGRDPDERMPSSVALAVLAAERGARIIRAHDVAPTVDALRLLRALKDKGEQS